jgi:hypothetical protein
MIGIPPRKIYGGKTARPVTPQGNEQAGGIKAHNEPISHHHKWRCEL